LYSSYDSITKSDFYLFFKIFKNPMLSGGTLKFTFYSRRICNRVILNFIIFKLLNVCRPLMTYGCHHRCLCAFLSLCSITSVPFGLPLMKFNIMLPYTEQMFCFWTWLKYRDSSSTSKLRILICLLAVTALQGLACGLYF
jgi:hypothetical protein